MTLAEFKAWFEGFTEDMEGQPNAKQWKRIKARVAQIDGVAITREVVYRDRYWPSYVKRTWFDTQPYTSMGIGASTVGVMDCGDQSVSASNLVDLGKSEFQSMLAS